MKKFSIVTSYYNRREQFYRTLKSIEKSSLAEQVEIIVTDDCSNEKHKINDFETMFKFPVKVIEVKSENRWYINPCVPFNIAIKEAIGEIIILQNPECLHVGDILESIDKKLKPTDYITIGCYSIDEQTTNKLSEINFNSDFDEVYYEILAKISPMQNRSVVEGQNSWYNHSIYRPNAYHFVSAIHKKNMDELGGFDERYAQGIGFDDDELLERIRKLGLNIKYSDSPFAIHQWHYSENNFFAKAVNPMVAFSKNQKIFNEQTKTQTTWKANQ